MEAFVDQRLGQIERGKPGAIEEIIREQRFVHARAAGGERRGVEILQAGKDVIGVEHRILGDLAQAIGAVAHHVAERADEHAHLAVEGDHAAEALVRMGAGGVFFDQFQAGRGLAHEWDRRERGQRGRQHNWA